MGKTKWTHTLMDGITAAWGVSEPGMCSKQIRICSLQCHGKKYQYLFGGDAKETGERMLSSPYCVPLENGSKPGDIFVWIHGHGEHGHIAARVEGNQFAHNTIANKRYGDGRGYLAFSAMDAPDVIVRLP